MLEMPEQRNHLNFYPNPQFAIVAWLSITDETSDNQLSYNFHA